MSNEQWFQGTFYLSGQMRPLPDHNFPLFQRATKVLRNDGFSIISPAELGDPSWTRGQLMADDLDRLIFDCDGVFCLPGWEKSPGACAEVACAFACEKVVYELTLHDDDSYELVESPVVSVRVPRENQYRDNIPLVGLCGYAQSGKDTAAKHLVEKYGFTRVAFADALRDVLYALNPMAGFDDTAGGGEYRVRDLIDTEGWDRAKTGYQEVRVLLQRLGTEAGRETIDQNLWVGLGENKIESAGGPVVVTDCRFPNELELIKRRQGVLIWVDREGVEAVNAHASEHSVTAANCDLILKNNGTIEDLQDALSQVFASVLTSNQ